MAKLNAKYGIVITGSSENSDLDNEIDQNRLLTRIIPEQIEILLKEQMKKMGLEVQVLPLEADNGE